MSSQKKLNRIDRPQGKHMVGDGFPVQTLLSYSRHGSDVSPFLLLDYAGPAEFEPSDRPRGVEEHPHRGFETVTIVYAGGLAHRDSGGNFGEIGPGDVQWMTAASGVVHEEMHSPSFTRSGGLFEVVQLWVNLPSSEKMSSPRYQEIVSATVPVVDLANGKARVIAGTAWGVTGPARTVTPLNVIDIRFSDPGRFNVQIPEGHTATIVVLDSVLSFDGEIVDTPQVCIFSVEGEAIAFDVVQPGKILVLSGEPIEEPIAGYGPFVMNTQSEIRQAVADYQAGRMGRLPTLV